MLATAMHFIFYEYNFIAGIFLFACSLVIVVNIAARIKLIVREILFFFGV